MRTAAGKKTAQNAGQPGLLTHAASVETTANLGRFNPAEHQQRTCGITATAASRAQNAGRRTASIKPFYASAAAPVRKPPRITLRLTEWKRNVLRNCGAILWGISARTHLRPHRTYGRETDNEQAQPPERTPER